MTQPDRNDRQLIQAYLDGALDAEIRRTIEARLAQEPALKAALNSEQQVRRQLQERMLRVQAPPALHAYVASALNTPARPPSLWQRLQAWLVAPQTVRPYQAALAALLLVVLVAGSMLWLRQPVAQRSIFDEIGGKHALYLDNKGLLDVAGHPADVAGWFNERLPFSVTVPNLPNLPLEGGRLGEIHHRAAAHLVFDQNGRDVSLTVFQPQPGDFDSGPVRQLDGQRYIIGSDGTHPVVLWQIGNLGYALVGPDNSSPDNLLSIAQDMQPQLK